MTTIQLISVQHPTGRQHEHVRAFGYRTTDTLKRIVEVPISVDEAVDILAAAQRDKVFPEIEIPDNAWVYCLNTGDIQMVSFNEPSGA